MVGLIFIKIFDVIPRIGFSQGLRQYTERKTTPRFQTISPRYLPEALDLYGVITITPKEAIHGAKKLIAIPQGLKKRNIVVTIPPEVHEGTRLRLRGLGQGDKDDHRGDLFLEVRILD